MRTTRGVHALWLFAALAALWAPTAAAAPSRRTTAHRPARSTSVDTPEAQLRRGRALSARGRHAEAVKVLDAALRADPHDPRVLNELGVALREIGDLTRAETVCREAAQSTEPELRGPALYNLARVLERRGDAAAAIAAYEESLRIRRTRAARERLIALDPKATSEMTRTHPLDGPVASIEQWCAAQTERQCDLHSAAIDLSFPDPDASRQPDPESPWQPGRHSPWEAARVFVSGSDPIECALGLRTARGWFVGPVMDCAAVYHRRRSVDVRFDDVVPSGQGRELQLSITSVDGYRVWDETTHSSAYTEVTHAALVVCGLGPSGVPHCTPDLHLTPIEGLSGGAKLAPRWAQGLMILEPAAADDDAADGDLPPLVPELRELAGRHRIIFP